MFNSFISPETNTYVNTEFITMRHESNNSAVFWIIVDARCEWNYRLIFASSFIKMHVCFPLNIVSHLVSLQTLSPYLMPRLILFERLFIQSGIQQHLEEQEQHKFLLRMSTGHPGDIDENISAIWFSVKLSMGLNVLALPIFLVECAVGFLWVDGFIRLIVRKWANKLHLQRNCEQYFIWIRRQSRLQGVTGIIRYVFVGEHIGNTIHR